ncbi:MAG TPA: ATP-binding protein [Gemmataceae bacterium]|nr:ATP-binding protein [Gemmataceae bacterium]
MNPFPFHRPRFISLAAVPIVASLSAVLVGPVVLIGWWLSEPHLFRIAAGLPAMSPTDALGFTFAGIALYLDGKRLAGVSWHRWSFVCGGMTAFLGMLILFEYFFDWNPGLDGSFQAVRALEASLKVPRLVSFHSGLALCLIGLGILLLDVNSQRGPQPAQLLAILVGNISLLALLGFIFGNRNLYTINRSPDAGMALSSCLLTGLLSLGILCARPNANFTAVVLSRGSGGVLARRLLLVPIILPTVFTLSSELGQRTGLFSKEFGSWLALIGYLTSFMLIIWWVASIVQRAEKERDRQEQQLVQLNTELADANKELEAFSYSVSHDLRAPLRAIDGFSRILHEECASVLESEHLTYLNDIRQNAQQMGQLIDALLSFAKLSRQPLKKHSVQMDELVHECLEYLADDSAERKLQLTVGQLPPCQADRTLLKQVWQNLIGNALKYSRHRHPAIVEIGSMPATNGGQTIYYVRDNGTGFDMTYAGKLFGVFQRLHRVEEFEGTGVGLAVVQRILHRHGGRAWAEAQLDKGATFYFTLGPNDA